MLWWWLPVAILKQASQSLTLSIVPSELQPSRLSQGAGMIHPSMSGPSSTLHATLLGLLATDAPIAPAALQAALDHAVSRSFNCISVDGDMSTNDTILALANGQAQPVPGAQNALPQGQEITQESHPKEWAQFRDELTNFCEEMAHLIVRDGEGAEKFVEINVKVSRVFYAWPERLYRCAEDANEISVVLQGAPTYDHAHAIASSISTSALVKCALHGGDANWGRILCAVGYAPLPSPSNWQIDPTLVTVSFVPPPHESANFEELVVLKDGAPQRVDENKAAKLLALEDICIIVDLKGGSEGKQGAKEEAKYWTCDFSKEYISVSGGRDVGCGRQMNDTLADVLTRPLCIYSYCAPCRAVPRLDQWRLQVSAFMILQCLFHRLDADASPPPLLAHLNSSVHHVTVSTLSISLHYTE